jgi:hypothetical protein
MGADDGGGPERYASEARRRLEAIRAAINRDLVMRLARLSTRGGVLTSTDAQDLDAARKVRAEVIALLREDALPVVITTAEVQMEAAVDAALLRGPEIPRFDEAGKPVAFSMDAKAKDQIARSVSGVLDEVAAAFKDGAVRMRRAIDLGLSTNASLADVTAEVQTALDTTFSKASVAVGTAIRGASRAALVMQAERGAQAVGEEMVYLWLGPSDSKNRDICEDNVGRAFTLAALKRMDNDMGLPVETYAGGWECRHKLSPLLRSEAIEEGYEVVG